MKFIESQKKDIKHLIVGAGPVAVTTGFVIKKYFDNSYLTLYTIDSPQEITFKDEVIQKKGVIEASGKLKGTAQIDEFLYGQEELSSLSNKYKYIWLCIPNLYYSGAIKSLIEANLIEEDITIIGISTRLGSGHEITSKLNSLNINKKVNVISLSTYFGASKPLENTRLGIWTRALKERVYAGSNNGVEKADFLVDGLKKIGVEIIKMENTLSAEAYNANIFIHAQLTLTNSVLDDIFLKTNSREYMYREEPEGTISLETCEQVVLAAEEINKILEKLDVVQINLANLLYKDLYPVPDYPKEKIENYLNSAQEEKIKIVKDWFLGRQKDPDTNEPHLEAVKLQKIVKEDNMTIIPRIPAEDFVCIVLLDELSNLLNIDSKTLSKMRKIFELKLNEIEGKTNIDLSKIESEMINLAKSIVK
jgi:hypothetical protein